MMSGCFRGFRTKWRRPVWEAESAPKGIWISFRRDVGGQPDDEDAVYSYTAPPAKRAASSWVPGRM